MSRALRVLHVVSLMDRGGVETWMMHVLRNVDRREIEIDFFVHIDRECAFDQEIRSLGARIIRCSSPIRRPWAYGSTFKHLVQENGPYDIIHCHLGSYSGYVLKLARAAGVPVRIAHMHTDTRAVESRSTIVHRQYRRVMDKWLKRHATVMLANSSAAAACLYGENWARDPRCRVLFYGLDFSPFQQKVERAAARAEIGVPQDAVAISHVGRFVDAKNHEFLIDVAAEVAKRNPRFCFVMVGDGPLRHGIVQKAANLGLQKNVLFTGERADIARILLASDGFIFPSLYEGLGIALVEGQAAGLPCVCSERVPQEATVIPELVQWLRLSDPISAWADAVIEPQSSPRPLSQPEALARVTESRFNVHGCVRELKRIYSNAIAAAERVAA